jgi:hypothetical protein
MTLINLPRPMAYPPGMRGGAALASAGSAGTIDAAGEYQGLVIQAQEALAITHFGIRPGTVTGTTPADLRIETVGADGLPSGTLWAANTNIVSANLTSNTWQLEALTATANIAKGEFFAAIAQFSSGTSYTLSQLSSFHPDPTGFFCKVGNTGTPARVNATNASLGLALGSSSTTFYCLPGMVAFTVETDTNFNSSSSPNRYGIRFKVPFKCRFRGGSFQSALTGDFTFAIYNDAGTLLGSIAVDGDQYTGLWNGAVVLDDDVTLEKATWYRMTVEATTATNQEVQTLTLPSTDYLSSNPWKENAHLTTWDGATWDDTATTQVPLMHIIVDQIDDGTGTGSTGGGAWTFA